MRTLTLMLILAGSILSGCGPKELSKEEALKLIRKEHGFPQVYDHRINISDPQHARELIDRGLEGKGFATVDRTQKLKDVGKPLIHFTEKARPYFIKRTADEMRQDYTEGVQKVKIGDEDVQEVKSVVTGEDNKTATVRYTTIIKNLTPFSALIYRNLKEPEENVATFVLSDQDGWILQKK